MNWLNKIFGPQCRLCGARGVSEVGLVEPTHPGKFESKNFTLQHCIRCDAIYLAPLPTASDLKLLYEDSKQFTDAHYTATDQVAKILDYYGSTVRTMGLVPRVGGKVLEIGAGFAWVSRACKQIDDRIVTVAQDVSVECAQICPWVDHYFVGPLDALPDSGPYDLISLTHVLEHLIDPGAMLRRIAALLGPNGNIFITAPYRPVDWQPGKGIAPWRNYSYLHVPAHITYFSRRWFDMHRHGLTITHWDAGHEDGQAFSLVLTRSR